MRTLKKRFENRFGKRPTKQLLCIKPHQTLVRALALGLYLTAVIFSDSVVEPQVATAQAPDKRAIVFPIIAPRLSSKFGMRIHPVRKFTRAHQGVDLAVPENSHVRAILGGRVVFAGDHAGYGKLVTIDHGKGYASLYGHLSEIGVSLGQELQPGTLIGRVGATGTATGPHLHFEWRQNGKPLNPLKVFPSLAEVSDG